MKFSVKSFVFIVCGLFLSFGIAQAASPVAEVMGKDEILAGIKSHDKALFIHNSWMRDPYIILGPDDYYYLTGTTTNEGDPREVSDPYNIGLGGDSMVGQQVRVWKSKDLAHWEYLGVIFDLTDTAHYKEGKDYLVGLAEKDRHLWAPELHWTGKQWALVHCPQEYASLALSAGKDLKGPWSHPMGTEFKGKHDPSLFQDVDGKWWLLWLNTLAAPLEDGFKGLAAEGVRIDPSGGRIDPNNKASKIARIGHEGATMRKIGDKYVHFGTAWSTDKMRKGSYNLYYCVSDKVTGPFGERRFAGRFLGHGTPFQTRDGKWWCTAFFNGNVPTISEDGIQQRDMSDNAYSINKRGTTIVPLDVLIMPDGDVKIRAIDPAYGVPGPDENQKSFGN